MYTLYYAAGSCSMAVHAVLNELNVPYELKIGIEKGQKNADFLKINPRGAVPTLVDDGTVIREGAAIITYLCDKHQSPLLPRDGKERAKALEWLMFANATLHPAYAKIFWSARTEMDAGAKAQLRSESYKHIQKLWDEVEKQLEHGTFICGNNITAGDILLTVISNWNNNLDNCTVRLGSRTKALLQQVSTRPAFQKAAETENVTYKVAA